MHVQGTWREDFLVEQAGQVEVRWGQAGWAGLGGVGWGGAESYGNGSHA